MSIIGSLAESESAPRTLPAAKTDIAPRKSRREQKRGSCTLCFYYSAARLQIVLSSFTVRMPFDEIEIVTREQFEELLPLVRQWIGFTLEFHAREARRVEELNFPRLGQFFS